MRRAACALFAASLALLPAARAQADNPLPPLLQQPTDDTPGPPQKTAAPSAPAKQLQPMELACMGPGYFNGIGSCHRIWAAQIDTSFDTNRVATSRIELSRAIVLAPPFSIVARVNAALAGDVGSGFYVVNGPIVSVGIRDQSRTGKVWLEVGVRFVPPWTGPNDGDPAAQRLALGATFSSAAADDARWLPLSDFGVQLYGATQSRTGVGGPANWKFYLGTMYGGLASVGPMRVRTWLGPQTGFIGNVFTDVFLGLLRLHGEDANLQVGLHGEVSLSTIWPADRPFPMLGGGFLAWSPEYWFAMRVFAGGSGSPGYTSVDTQYGFRAEFFVP